MIIFLAISLALIHFSTGQNVGWAGVLILIFHHDNRQVCTGVIRQPNISVRAGQDVSLGCDLTNCPPASSITWLRSDQDDLQASPRYPLVSDHPTMLTLKVMTKVWPVWDQFPVHRRRCQRTPGGIGATRTLIRSWPMSVSRILCRWWTLWSLRWELSRQQSHQWNIVTMMSRRAMLTNFGCMKLTRISGKTNRYFNKYQLTYAYITFPSH